MEKWSGGEAIGKVEKWKSRKVGKHTHDESEREKWKSGKVEKLRYQTEK